MSYDREGSTNDERTDGERTDLGKKLLLCKATLHPKIYHKDVTCYFSLDYHKRFYYGKLVE